MKRLILIGDGGHGKVVREIAAEHKEFELYAIIDDAFEYMEEIDGIIHANRTFLEGLKVEEYQFCIAIGNNAIRKSIYANLNIPAEGYTALIHPRAAVSKSARIGRGAVVMANAVINANSTIGSHSIINSGAVVEHDNVIADYVHISPNATLAGGVKVDEGSQVGSGATVIPGKSIGEWSLIGAGSVVVDDIASNVTVVGIPAQIMK